MISAKPQPEHFEFSPAMKQRFDHTLAKYEQPASALLPTLYLAQEEFGYLSPGAMEYVGKLLGMPTAHVFEAVMFYSMYKKKDMGRFCLQVCNNVTCTMMGSEELLAVVKDELGLEIGGLTADGKFSLMAVQCLGSCDTAPVVQINEDYHEKLNPGRFRELLKSLSREVSA